MTFPPRPETPGGFFAEPFGRLVALLRLEPANVAAQKEALRQAMTLLRFGPVLLDAGYESSSLADEGSLKSRLLARRVDTVQVFPEAAAAEVLRLARALADDVVPLLDSEHVAVRLLPTVPQTGPALPPTPGLVTSLSPPLESPTRSRTMAGPDDEVQRYIEAFQQAAGQEYWVEALHAAQALVAMAHRYPEHEQRSYYIGLRRVFTREILVSLVQHAMRHQEDQYRVVQVLRAVGPPGFEVAAEEIASADAVGPRAFLYDLLASTPEALRLILAMLQHHRPAVIQHGALILGRLGLPDAIPALRALADHPDAGVRQAAVIALGRFEDGRVVEPIRRALSDAAPTTRITAAHVLASRQSSALAMPIIAALEEEKDPGAWREMVLTLGRMDSGEATGALLTIALARRTFFRSGKTLVQRLTAVESLAASPHARARRALERLAQEAEGAVRTAAMQAVKEGGRGQ